MLLNRPRLPGILLLASLLVVVVVSAGELAASAWCSDWAQKAANQRALGDLASYAAWSAARSTSSVLQPGLRAFFEETRNEPAGGPLPPVSAVRNAAVAARECKCLPTIPAEAFFRLTADGATDIVSDSLRPPREAAAPAWQADPGWLRSVVLQFRVERELAIRGPDVMVVVAPQADQEWAVAFLPSRDRAGKSHAVYGVIMDPVAYVGVAFPRMLRERDFLPASASHGLPREQLLALTVNSPSGRTLFRSAPDADSLWRSAGAIRDSTSTEPPSGSLKLRVTLRPDAVRFLRVGSDVASPTPFWMTLLGAAIVLTGLVAWRMRHEQEVARHRAEFATSVSHELRTPLAQILLFGETLTLGRTRSAHERQTAAEVIVREGRRLMQLVENAIHFARADRRVVTLVARECDLAEEMGEIVVSFAPLARVAGMRIKTELVSGVHAMIDRNAFRQMLLNLLDNAVRYGPRGQTITVRLRVVAIAARIEVTDQGPGVQSGERERIWQPFIRGRDAETAGTTGSGIGLAVVRDLVVRHHGRVWVEEAAPGTGAAFVLELPLAPATAPASRDSETRLTMVATPLPNQSVGAPTVHAAWRRS